MMKIKFSRMLFLIEQSNYLMSKLLKQDALRLLDFPPQHTLKHTHILIQIQFQKNLADFVKGDNSFKESCLDCRYFFSFSK